MTQWLSGIAAIRASPLCPSPAYTAAALVCRYCLLSTLSSVEARRHATRLAKQKEESDMGDCRKLSCL